MPSSIHNNVIFVEVRNQGWTVKYLTLFRMGYGEFVLSWREGVFCGGGGMSYPDIFVNTNAIVTDLAQLLRKMKETKWQIFFSYLSHDMIRKSSRAFFRWENY